MSSNTNVFKISITVDGATTKKKVERADFTIGRHPDCELVLSHPQVSRHHLKVEVIDGDLTITDLGSSNGTFLGSKRLKANQNYMIDERDSILLGSSGPSVQITLEDFALPKFEVPVATPLKRTEDAPLAPPPPTLRSTEKEFEKLIIDARKHASKIIHEAEMQAEQKLQAAHQRVIETEQRADKIFQDRMKEAHIEAEKFSKSAREETLALLQESRAKTKALRDQAEESSRSMRQETERKCQEIIALAEKQGQEIKEQRLSEADEIIEQRGIELLKDTKEQVEREKQEHQERISSELSAHKKRISSERTSHETSIKNERQEFDERIQKERQAHEQMIKQELHAHESQIEKEKTAHAELIESEKTAHKRKMDSERESHLQRIADEREALAKELEAEKKSHEKLMNAEKEYHTNEIESFKKEIKALAESKASAAAEVERYNKEIEEASGEAKKLETRIQQQQALVAKIKDEEKESLDKKLLAQKNAAEEFQKIQAELKAYTEQKAQLKSELEKLSISVTGLRQERDQRQMESESQIKILKSRVDQERARVEKEEEERANNLKLEAVKQIKKLERDMIEEILAKKSQMAREILLQLEAACQSLPLNPEWNKQKSDLHQRVQNVLGNSSQTWDQKENPEKHVKQALNQRRKEKFISGVMGFCLAALTMWGGQLAYQKFSNNPSPLERMVASAADAKKQDLEARKYNPPQTGEVKDSYVDSVIFTRGFSSTYINAAYQEEWNKEATRYLLKTWRIEEDRSTRVLALSAALVKDLQERKEKIHPDFVKKGIAQMREAEAASVARLKEELGGEVRLESFKKFEKRFFEKYPNKQP